MNNGHLRCKIGNFNLNNKLINQIHRNKINGIAIIGQLKIKMD